MICLWYLVGAGEDEVMQMPQIKHLVTIEGFQHWFRVGV